MVRQHACVLGIVTICLASAAVHGLEPIEIGSRRELFVDDFMVERFIDDAQLKLHRPTPREVVLVTDKPWEGNTCAYYTILQDGDRYRMYYRGSHYDEATGKASHREVTCYAESTDGIHWTKPGLGLFDFDGSRQNNIVWDGVGTHNFTPFIDTNPSCQPQARYKALGRGDSRHQHGLYAFQSADGIHWELMSDRPVITQGAFDSQNLAFFDNVRGHYIEYHRQGREGLRDIMTATSRDFLNWSEPQFLSYSGAPREHLYTNAIRPYYRAPHILIGFPTRFLPPRQQVEPTFMTSRDGLNFHRWPEALIPLSAPQDRDGNRSNYMAYGLVQLPGQEKELTLYATEAYYTGPDSRLRRFTIRVDGFVSVQAPLSGGEVVTRPIRFDGANLLVNFTTSPQGSVRVQIEDAQGIAVPGFRLEDCQMLRGDAVDAAVSWNGPVRLQTLSGQPVRVRIALADAGVYSFRFAAASDRPG